MALLRGALFAIVSTAGTNRKPAHQIFVTGNHCEVRRPKHFLVPFYPSCTPNLHALILCIRIHLQPTSILILVSKIFVEATVWFGNSRQPLENFSNTLCDIHECSLFVPPYTWHRFDFGNQLRKNVQLKEFFLQFRTRCLLCPLATQTYVWPFNRNVYYRLYENSAFFYVFRLWRMAQPGCVSRREGNKSHSICSSF